MRYIAAGVIGAAIFAVSLLPALAADPITVPFSSGESVGVAEATDWSGFYAGVYGVAQAPAGADLALGLGVNAGVNAQLDFVLLGAEVALHGLADEALDTAYGQVIGRAGVVLTDDVLLYAAAGLGSPLGGDGDAEALLGGGVEFAISDELSVGAQYLRGFSFEGGESSDQVTLGARFHF